jgi:hypothetical protein
LCPITRVLAINPGQPSGASCQGIDRKSNQPASFAGPGVKLRRR